MEGIQTMSEQEIHIQTHIGSDGIAHLDIPLGIVDQDIDLTVSYALSEPEPEMPNVDHLLGSFSSAETQDYIAVEEETAFGQAVIEKLANQGVELP